MAKEGLVYTKDKESLQLTVFLTSDIKYQISIA